MTVTHPPLANDSHHEPAIIHVENLVKSYPRRPTNAVDGISFDVLRGEIFGLLGPNGAGKTTTIGVLTTRVRPTGGLAQIDGINVALQPVEAKRRIAVVPQLNNLDRSLTARQNLVFHAAYFGLPRAEREALADRLLDQFGLADRAQERVDRFSGGMAQRLMIARALIHQPEVLFLDEPTTGLDPQSRLFVWDRVREMNQSGLSVVLTTHDMDEAEAICNRVAIIDHGHLLALDTPVNLKRLVPGSRVLTLQLSFAAGEKTGETVKELVRTLEALAGVDRVEPRHPLGELNPAESRGEATDLPARPSVEVTFRIYAEGSGSFIGKLAEIASQAGADIKDLKSGDISLEDVFIHFTGRGLR